MHCPYCRQPLEALVIQGRHTGAWQCINCQGSFLRFQELGGLLGAGSPSSQALVPLGFHPPGADQSIQPVVNPWTAHGQTASQRAPQGASREQREKRTPGSRWNPFKKSTPEPPPVDQNFDLCTWCGQPEPGDSPNCRHCNVERMRCPQCQSLMTGVRRHQVLVELCVSCQGLFFEKGRLELLLQRIRGGGALPEGTVEQKPASLLMQLAQLLEDTEPDAYSVGNQENRGVFHTVAQTIGAGLGSGRKVLYDLMIMLGDTGGKPPGRSS